MATDRPAAPDRRNDGAYGVPQEAIAKTLGVAAKTLRKHCKTELAIGTTIAIFRVADALFKMAIDPNGGAASVAAAIFFLKALAGWKETGVNHHTGTDRA
jgi:hypothetical protein